MKSLAALRTSVVLMCLPIFAAACGGGGSTSASPGLPGASVPQQSVAGIVQQSSLATAHRAAGLQPGCTPFPYPAPLLPQPCTIYVGGFISPNKVETPAQQIASTAVFEQQIGRKLATDLHYYQWTDGFPGIGEADDLKNGRIPLISWHCGGTDYDIVNGKWDTLLSQRAAAFVAYGGPVFLRYKWEMNLLHETKCADSVNDPPGHYNPSLYIAAYRHIRAIFAAGGVSNVTWVFNPSSSGNPPDPYYPGDSYVDWIAFDHYDTSMTDSFYTTFSATKTVGPPSRSLYTYPYFTQGPFSHPTKPLMIGETGALQTNQTSFLGGADASLQQQFPNIQAIFYWDSTGARGNYLLQQYGLSAFAQFAAGSYEQGSKH